MAIPKPPSPEIRRKAKEIVEQSGANSEARFHEVTLGEITFREQAEAYLQAAVSRKRNPLRDTVSVEGALSKWFYPPIGDLPLSQVDNLALKPIVEKMSASFSPRTVNKYVEYAKHVVESLKGPNGEPVFNRTWDAETMDLPVVVHSEQIGRTITVEQQVKKDSPEVVKYLKTNAAKRQVDLHPDIAEYLQRYGAEKLACCSTQRTAHHIFTEI
jgi:hypothetical protein